MERKGEQGTLNELEEQIVLGTTELIIRRPADVESLIDEERFADREFLPYWAELWPSGLALARFVAGLDLRGNDVLELGCGLALPSLAAALAGAAVTATDWAPESIDLIRRNAHANGLSIAAQELDWAAPVDLDRYHVVLAADVLYEERNAEPLLRLLDDAVAPGGVALFADPGRRHAQAFFDRARGSGWSLELTATDELPSGSMVRLSRSAG
ncbi:methyltransferase domain-containing protein [Gaiella sp.]|uniref:class I SAM-dependent methyltransferase n=1 Tax=Gaiella sp. TaxID=2663207 RepID=UPI0032671145